MTCVANDAAGNAATGKFHVIVKDATPPTIAKAPDMTIEATSEAGAAVIFALPLASDAVGVTSAFVRAGEWLGLSDRSDNRHVPGERCGQ